MASDLVRKPFEWVGGAPALDFTNTVTWSPDGLRNERLAEYADLLAWVVESGLVGGPDAERFRAAAASAPARAEAALRKARRLREVLHETFLAAAEQRMPSGEAAGAFNSALSDALRRLRLEPGGTSWSWGWRHEKLVDPADPLHAVIWSAAGLLTSAGRPLLKRCAAEGCGWVFFDLSRNHSRRWCDMKACGNNAKARRFYQRRRTGSGG